MQRFAGIAVLGLLMPGLRAQEPEATPEPEGVPTFGSEVELVTVDVVITDKDGKPVKGLGENDFVIREDGKPQGIVSFEAVELPATALPEPPPSPPVSSNVPSAEDAWTGRSFAIVFDDIHLAPFQAQRAKAAVAEFLTNAVREGDRVSLVSSGGEAWWTTRMLRGRDQLIALLKRLDGRQIPDRSPDRISPYEAMRIWAYSDPLVENRVARRLDNYGATPQRNDRFEQMPNNPFRTDSDPMIRSKASEVYFDAIARMRVTLGVMERVLESLQETKGRKSLVMVSAGFIYDSNVSEFKDVIEAARRSNVAIYFLDTKGLQGLPTHYEAQFGPPLATQDLGAAFIEGFEAAHGTESLALDTGGFVVRNTNDLGKGISRIAEETQNYYLLGYYPSNTARDGAFRKIDVDVAGRGLEVRARKGYYAPRDEALAVDRDDDELEGDPEFQRALDSPFEIEDIPLRMTAYVFDEKLLGKASAMVVTEVDVSGFGFEKRVSDGQERYVDTLEFFLVAAHRDSGEYLRYDQKIEMKLLPATWERLRENWLPIVRDFELAPGGYQAKIVVRDAATGRIGTVVHEFEVPELSELRTSSLILSDTLERPPPGRDNAPPRPKVLARRSFPQDSTLFCQYDVYGAGRDEKTGLPVVMAGYEVRAEDGRVVVEAAPTEIRPTSLGGVSRIFGASLKDAKPGRYELVLEVNDLVSGQKLEVREPFWLDGETG